MRPDNLLTYDDINGSDDIEHDDRVFKFHQALHGIFACHPREFSSANNVKPIQHVMYNDEITVTSKGLKFTTALWGTGPDSLFAMPLYCYDQTPSCPLGIHMRWVGGDIYARTNVTNTIYLPTEQAPPPSQDDIFATHKIYYLQDCLRVLHRNSIRIPEFIYSENGTMKARQLERTKVSPGFLWCEERDLLMTHGARFPLACATYQIIQQQSKAVGLVLGLDHMEKPWLCLVEPGSQLAPSHIETRRGYLDRIWRSASQERFENIHFVANATWEHKTQTCEFNINGRFGNSVDWLDGQPIFNVSLEAHIVPISPFGTNVENIVSTPGTGQNFASDMTTWIGGTDNSAQGNQSTTNSLPIFLTTSGLEREQTRARPDPSIPAKTSQSLRSLISQYIPKKTSKSPTISQRTEPTDAHPIVTRSPNQVSEHYSSTVNLAPRGANPTNRHANPPGPDQVQYRQSRGLSVVTGTDMISTQSVHTSSIVGYTGVRHTSRQFTTASVVNIPEDNII